MRKWVLVPIVIFLIGVMLLKIVFLVPGALLTASVGDSVEFFEKEGTYPSYGVYPRKIVLDNFTDSIMVNTAYSVTDNSLQSALLAERQILSTSEVDQIKNLRAAYEGQAPVRSSYERYWHGYLVYLRPLLAVFSYQEIRNMLHGLSIGLFGLLGWQIFRKRGLGYAITLLVGAVAVDFFFVGQSIQFVQVFLIGMIAALVLLRSDNIDVRLLFLVTGMMTMFFDLLTAPLISLGFLLIADRNRDIREMLGRVGLWIMGYAGFGLSKWLLVQLLLGRNALVDAFGHVVNRSINRADADFSHLRAVWLNVMQLVGYARLSQVIIGVIGLILILFLLTYRKRQVDTGKIWYWMAVGSIPYLWYLLAANHSYLHVWYSYRNQFLTVVAGVLLYCELIDWKKLLRIRGLI